MWLLLACSPATIQLGTDSPPPPHDSGLVEESTPQPQDTALESIPPGDTAPAVEEGPDELLYEPERVIELRLELDNDAYNELRWDGHRYVDATLIYGEWEGPVQIHIKGSSTWQSIDDKPSLVIDVDNRTPGFEFMGEEKFYLHNQTYDPSMFSENLSYNFYRSFGYPASRINYARITLNGDDYGFYTIVEPHEDEFLRQHFDDPAGNLYENSDAYCDVWDLSCMEKEEFDENNDDAIEELGRAARQGDWDTLKTLIDYPRFIDHMALEAGISHWDSYSYDLSNYKIYHNPTHNQWTFLTQSMDLDFGWRPWSYPSCAQYAMDPGAYTMGALAQLCQENAECHADFLDGILRVADALEAAHLDERVRELDALYGSEVQSDPRRYYDNRAYQDHIECLQGFFEDRPAQLRTWAQSQ